MAVQSYREGRVLYFDSDKEKSSTTRRKSSDDLSPAIIGSIAPASIIKATSIIRRMDKRAALYQQFDPARPLEADSNLYVDWQRDLADALDRDDLKPRLANSISLSGNEPVTRLLTGTAASAKPPS